MTDAVDRYLRRLAATANTRGAGADDLVAEAEAHLRDVQDDLVAAGRSPDDAALEAVARFGDPGVVADAVGPSPTSARGVLALVTVGLLAAGVAGLVGVAVSLVAGAAGTAGTDGDPTGVLVALGAGVVGLAALEWLWVTSPRPPWASALGDPTAGAVLFAVGAAACGVAAVVARARSADVAAARWSVGAVVALAVAVAYGRARSLRRHRSNLAA